MTKRKNSSKDGKAETSPSRLMDAQIKALDDWRGEAPALSALRSDQRAEEVVKLVRAPRISRAGDLELARRAFLPQDAEMRPEP